MARPPSSEDPGAPTSKVTSDLAARIASAKKVRVEQQTQPPAAAQVTGLSRALRLGSEFIAAIIVGLGIGFLLDQWLNTRPWIMLVMLLVGFAAGIMNITRSVGEMNRAAPPPPGSDLGPDDDDEDER